MSTIAKEKPNMSTNTPDKPQEQFVSLATLANGSAVDLFDTEMKKVLTNILDPNTKADAVRSVTLKVDFKPSETRGVSEIAISAVSKLAPPKSAKSTLYIGTKKGEAVAVERDPNQMSFDDIKPETPNAGADASVANIQDRRK